MHTVLLVVNGLVMVLLPLAAGTFLARRYRADWGLFGVGAATFVAAQALHIPFNSFVEARYLPDVDAGFSVELMAVATFYGLSAGAFEEVARYLTFRSWRKDARSWAEGLMVGAGHGGVEALIVGLLFLVNLAILLGMSRGYFQGLAPPDAMPAIETQLEALYGLPWYETLLGGVERALAIVVHLALSLIVLRAVRRRSLLWLLLAIGWHATFNGVALVTAAVTSPVLVEMVIAVFALFSVCLIARWREAPGQEDSVEVRKAPLRAPRVDASELGERLDESRFI